MDIRDAVKTLRQLKDFAVRSDIYHAWFICFGTLLGAIRPTERKWGQDTIYVTGVMEHDDDMDVGILSDKVTKEQEDNYRNLIKNSKLTLSRGREPGHVQRRSDNNRLLWMTLRGYKPPVGTKVCHWFWQRWNGHYWHSKGKKWINFNKFNDRTFDYTSDDEAMMLGVPVLYIENLIEIDFDGIKVNVPVMSGSCCDLWYPGWLIPRQGGTSAKTIVGRVPRWNNPEGWQVLPTVRM